MSNQILDDHELERNLPTRNIRRSYYAILENVYIFINGLVGLSNAIGLPLFLALVIGPYLGASKTVEGTLGFMVVLVGAGFASIFLFKYFLRTRRYFQDWRKASERYIMSNDDSLILRINSSYFSAEVVFVILYWGIVAIALWTDFFVNFKVQIDTIRVASFLFASFIGPLQIWFILKTKKHIKSLLGISRFG